MKIPMFDLKTGEPAGEAYIPDDVMDAAIKVEAWMKLGGTTELCGLRLARHEQGRESKSP